MDSQIWKEELINTEAKHSLKDKILLQLKDFKFKFMIYQPIKMMQKV